MTSDFFGEDGRRKSFEFRGDDENRYNGIYNGEEPLDGKDIHLFHPSGYRQRAYYKDLGT